MNRVSRIKSVWAVLAVVLFLATASTARAGGPVLLSDDELGQVTGGRQLDFEVDSSGGVVTMIYGNEAKNFSFDIGSNAFRDAQGVFTTLGFANSVVDLNLVVNIYINRGGSGLI